MSPAVLAFILRRILQSALVMTVVAFIAFGLFNFTGDPVQFMVGQDTTREERARLRSELGLDKPFYVQFVRYVGNAVQGEFGLSLRQARKVSVLLKERLPATLELATSAALLALLVGIPLGVYTALRRHSVASHVLLAGSLIGVSLPTFLIGILLILIFGVQLRWLPGVVRARRYGGVRLVDHRPSHQERAQGADPADDHALARADDAHHAARPVRDSSGCVDSIT